MRIAQKCKNLITVGFIEVNVIIINAEIYMHAFESSLKIIEIHKYTCVLPKE